MVSTQTTSVIVLLYMKMGFLFFCLVKLKHNHKIMNITAVYSTGILQCIVYMIVHDSFWFTKIGLNFQQIIVSIDSEISWDPFLTVEIN